MSEDIPIPEGIDHVGKTYRYSGEEAPTMVRKIVTPDDFLNMQEYAVKAGYSLEEVPSDEFQKGLNKKQEIGDKLGVS